MHIKIKNQNLVENAKSLRKNPTKEEKTLWYQFLNSLPVKFTRQKVIHHYIVDFCCAQLKIIIELDGTQHYEVPMDEQDRIRDAFLENLGYTVLRYSDKEVNSNFKGVCQDIWDHLGL